MRDVTPPPVAASARVIMRIMDGGEWRPNPPVLRDESWSAPLAVRALVSLSLFHQGSWFVGRGRHGVVWTEEAVRGGGSGSALRSSRCASCSRDMRLKVPARVQNARFGVRGRAGAARGRERGDRRGRRPCRGPRVRRLSESVAKVRIAPKRRKRIVDILRFCPPRIPARGAFVTDSDTPPSRPAPGAPPAPLCTRPPAPSRRSRPVRGLSW